jgi:6-phosphogluconate dehydrogenase
LVTIEAYELNGSKKMKSDIGVIGLAVMGENLILNMESKGFTVSCYNRTTTKVDDFVNGRASGKNIIGCRSLKELVTSLAVPRKVMLMIKAGPAVDALIDQLTPLLEPGDIIIDGGNSHFSDTARRVDQVERCSLYYVGSGVSGGEEGALLGPSLMPGGSKKAWPAIKPIFQKIAAQTTDGQPCCDWVGSSGSGHFVKMVHNGIEYGDMQMICEVYQFMRDALSLSNDEISAIFTEWNTGVLDSYLIEITAEILARQEEDGTSTLDLILDKAGQKGTGKWTVQSALDLGQPVSVIAEAVFSRCISAMKEERVEASELLKGPAPEFKGDKAQILEDLKQALYASKIISYAQGYQMMRAAAVEYNWELNYGNIALMWRGGCIIRSAFLGKISEAFNANPDLSNLLLDSFFVQAIETAQPGWRRVIAAAALNGITVPALSAALAYFDGYRTANLPANLLQAQRDYFGAHTYERIDQPRGKFFHTNWTGRGGDTASTSYDA